MNSPNTQYSHPDHDWLKLVATIHMGIASGNESAVAIATELWGRYWRTMSIDDINKAVLSGRLCKNESGYYFCSPRDYAEALKTAKQALQTLPLL